MAVFRVDWDVAELTRSFIDTNWGTLADSDGPSKPANIELVSEDADGNPRKGVDYTEEYILVVETGDRNTEYIDGPRDVADLRASCNLEISTPQSRTRREALHDELQVLAKGARKRAGTPGTPGEWDTATLDAATVDDEVFNWWSIEATFTYEAEARTV